MTQAVDFGNIGLTAEGTARIVLRNTATCLPIPGGDACASCNLQIRSADTSLPGLRFKEGTNDDGFSASSALRQTRSTFPNLMLSVTSPAKYGSS